MKEEMVKIQANRRTRAMHLVVFAAALVLLLVSGLVGGVIWIAATPGDQDGLEEYQWSASEKAQRDQAIAARDSSLLPACTEEYFAWREETKAARESADRSEPVGTDFWSAPGCRGTPDRLVQGPARSPSPEMPTASPHDRPVLDVDYDDSWVANFPDVIGGYTVLYITTPKSVACSRTPLISLKAPQESMDEFLSAPLDVNSLEEAIRSIPGVPSSFNLSFSGGLIALEEVETRIRERNEFMASRGCHHFVDPDGPATVDPEPPGNSEKTADAAGPQQSDREVMDPQDSPVIDVDYDDSWVADFPDVIGGYRVIRITTPKSVACTSEPLISLQAVQESMDEFLSTPLDLASLRAAIRSVPGVPSHLTLSFVGPAPIDEEEVQAGIRKSNEANISRGSCTHFTASDRLLNTNYESPVDSE